MGRARSAGVAAALALACSATAAAQDPRGRPPGGIELGWRTGYAMPAGDAIGMPNGQKALALGDVVTGALPLRLEGGYRLVPAVFVGADVELARALLSAQQGCPVPGVSCRASRILFGPEVQLHAWPGGEADPWAGIALGYEVLNVDSTLGGGSFRGGTLELSLGVDWRPDVRLAIGPFAAGALGWFLGCTSSSGASCSLPAIGTHEWLTLGVRAAFDLAVGR